MEPRPGGEPQQAIQSQQIHAPQESIHNGSKPSGPSSASASQHTSADIPQFGKPSPLRNPLKPKMSAGNRAPQFFVSHKPGQPRPEHHLGPVNNPLRPVGSQAKTKGSAEFKMPTARSQSPTAGPRPAFKVPDISLLDTERGPVHIPRPGAAATSSSYGSRPLYSTQGGFKPVNAFKMPLVDLVASQDNDDQFDPSKAFGGGRFGDADPLSYMELEQANENIKALLEGAFDEDDEDRPKRRLRRSKNKSDPELDDVIAAVDKVLKTTDGPSEVAGAVQMVKPDSVEDTNETEEDDGTVEGLTVRLLPHQIEGVAWMLDKEMGTRKKNGVLPNGGILADDMGLGKTIQALSLILSNPRPSADEIKVIKKRKIPETAGKGTLVVAPLSLIKQWEAEIKDKVNTDKKFKVLVHHGASRTKSPDALKKYDVVITTYQTLTSEHDGSAESETTHKTGVFGVHWYRIILDEAHSIKNRSAKMTQAAYALQSVYRWCLTGTPIQNNLDELQSLIRFLRIKPYCELRSWRDQISQPMKNGRGGLAMKRLQYFLKAFMKRRTKDVLKQEGGLTFGTKAAKSNSKGEKEGFKIVARDVHLVVTEFTPQERDFYDKLQNRAGQSLDRLMKSSKKGYIGALVLLLRLRQTCNHPKLIEKSLRGGDELASEGILQTPRKAKAANVDDVDEMAELFGGLSVKTKQCDICQVTLDLARVDSGSIHCEECSADIHGLHRSLKSGPKKKKPVQTPTRATKRYMHTRRIVESDDEDDEGEEEWLVQGDAQKLQHKSKAGGPEDEDAEGGGEWLRSDDSDTEDNSDGEPTAAKDQEDKGDSSDDPDAVSGLLMSTKIRHLLEILEKETAEHKFIVFSEFTSMLDLVEPFLQSKAYRYVRYDGSMRNDDREASLHQLRTNSKVRILLCSLKCGSLGLNLTAASRVVILEPFWNPFIEEQAIDRVHRLNQTQDVKVYRMTIKDTVEERILALQETKRQLAKAAIEGGKSTAKLSMQDILRLFGREAESESHEAQITLPQPSGGLLHSSQDAEPSRVSQGRGPVQRPNGRVVSGSSQFDPAYSRRW